MRQSHRRVVALMVAFGAMATAATAQGSDLQTIELESGAVNRTIRYNIVLRPSYETSRRSYPVLCLLHGLGGNYTDWERLGAEVYIRLYNDLIIVMPDGDNARYVYSANSEKGQTNNREDWIIEELITHVDEKFRTIDRREGRAINGLSMGAFGAITLGLRPPDIFIAISSTSGSLEDGAHDASSRVRVFGHIVASQYEVMQRALGERPDM